MPYYVVAQTRDAVDGTFERPVLCFLGRNQGLVTDDKDVAATVYGEKQVADPLSRFLLCELVQILPIPTPG